MCHKLDSPIHRVDVDSDAVGVGLTSLALLVACGQQPSGAIVAHVSESVAVMASR